MGSIRILKASAGSGKTYRLAYEYVRNVIAEPALYSHILAVTFTNKATEEMKQRIISEMHLLAAGLASNYLSDICTDLELSADQVRERARRAQSYILHDYSHFSVLTIDKFFQRIIRAFIKELGIDLNFNLELQTDSLLSNATDALIEQISSDEALREWIIAFVDDKIGQNRNWDIRRELMSLGGEIFKESYKRVDNSAIDKQQLNRIVSQQNALSKSVKEQMCRVAEQSLDVIASAGLSADDFLGGKNGFANYFYKVASGDISAYSQRVTNALDSDDKWYTKTSPAKARIQAVIPQLRPLLEELCRLYDSNICQINSAALLSANYRNFALLGDLSTKIIELCAKANIMPISETNHILKQLISDNDTPFIFEKVGNNFSHFMIDEFQDTSVMQWDNFVPLLRNALSESEGSPVLLVGDVKQSIYRWRGGDWQILGGKAGRMFDNVEPEVLGTNFRSTRNIVEFNNNIIESIVKIDNNTLNERLASAQSEGLIDREWRNELHDMLQTAYCEHSQVPKKSEQQGYINITFYPKKDKINSGIPPVIEHIEDMQRRGYSPGDIAILVRYNADGAHIANMLLDHKSRNPESPYCYDVVTAEALTIGASPMVGFIVSCLHLSVNRGDLIRRAIFNRWLDRAHYQEIDDQDDEFLRQLSLLSPEEAFEQILIKFDLGNNPDGIAYIQALHQQIISFCNSNVADIQLFLKWWSDKGFKQSVNIPKSSSAITIISIHKAKGLEFKAVVIPYCNWTLSPKDGSIIWAEAAAEPISELKHIPVGVNESMGSSLFAKEYYKELVLSHIDNINTFYVATTRACEELHIMMPRAKSSKGKISSLIVESLSVTGDRATLGELCGSAKDGAEDSAKDSGEDGGDKLVIEFGTPMVATQQHKESESIITPTTYPTRSPGVKVKLRQRIQRYLADGEVAPMLSPRNYGVLMHSLFEKARTVSDIEAAAIDLRKNGLISNSEAEELQRMIASALENPIINEWFTRQWDSIHTESEIIVPGRSSIRRPDRVMTRGNSAIIVDYKFGLNRRPAHTSQITEYATLLSQMGYSSVQGYIWYVSINDLTVVDFS